MRAFDGDICNIGPLAAVYYDDDEAANEGDLCRSELDLDDLTMPARAAFECAQIVIRAASAACGPGMTT